MIKITDYRGWEISFDTEKEVFHALSDRYDTENAKNTFSAIKKYIDDFIKENDTFKPFWVDKIDTSSKDSALKIIGIRKDKSFITENKSGIKSRLSPYDERYYMLRVDSNRPILDEIVDLKKERDEVQRDFNQKIQLASKSLEIKTLNEIKDQYTQYLK